MSVKLKRLSRLPTKPGFYFCRVFNKRLGKYQYTPMHFTIYDNSDGHSWFLDENAKVIVSFDGGTYSTSSLRRYFKVFLENCPDLQNEFYEITD